MKAYFRQRVKQYIFPIIGVLIGSIIGSFIFEEPNYVAGITCAVIGLLMGETFVYIKWLQKKE